MERGGRILVDGGVTANVPVRQAVEAGARTVVVLDANPSPVATTAPHGVIDGLLATIRSMLRSQRSTDPGRSVAGTVTVITLPSVTPADLSSFDFSRTQSLAEAGYEAASAYLRDLGVAEVCRCS